MESVVEVPENAPNVSWSKEANNIEMMTCADKTQKKRNVFSRVFTWIWNNIIKKIPMALGWLFYIIGITGTTISVFGSFIVIFCYYPMVCIVYGIYFHFQKDNCTCPERNIPEVLLVGGIISVAQVLTFIHTKLEAKRDTNTIQPGNLEQNIKRKLISNTFWIYWVGAALYLIYAIKINSDFEHKSWKEEHKGSKCQHVFPNGSIVKVFVIFPIGSLSICIYVLGASTCFLYLARSLGNSKAAEYLKSDD